MVVAVVHFRMVCPHGPCSFYFWGTGPPWGSLVASGVHADKAPWRRLLAFSLLGLVEITC